MPSKKKKYNARFPAGRIKKIMQTDEEVGKVAQAVPVIISRALELFIESLLTKSMQITLSRNAKTLTPSHMKQCILSESRFDFLKDLVKNIPDASVQEDNENNACFDAGTFERNSEISNPTELNTSSHETRSSPRGGFYTEQSTSAGSRTPVIQYGPKVSQEGSGHLNFSISRIMNNQSKSGDSSHTENSEGKDPQLHITLLSQPLPVPELVPSSSNSSASNSSSSSRATPRGVAPAEAVPSLVPLSLPYYAAQNTGDNLCIDEDYDN